MRPSTVPSPTTSRPDGNRSTATARNRAVRSAPTTSSHQREQLGLAGTGARRIAAEPRRAHARQASERIDLEPRVFGQHRHAEHAHGRSGLEARVLEVRRSGLDVAEPDGKRHDLDRRAGKDLAGFLRLAFVGRREDDEGAHADKALRCASTSCAIPDEATASMRSSVALSNDSPSAVPCTSTKLPAPVITTFMSTSARTSSE